MTIGGVQTHDDLTMASLPGDPPMAADTPAQSPDIEEAQPTDVAPVASSTDETTTNNSVQTGEQGGATISNEGNATTVKKKKRKNRPKKSVEKRGETAQNYYRGTGFEEYYCDPPLTANEQWEEQNNIYTSDRSFEARIEDCIQRFRARRRMNSERNNYFSKYLMLGGIDTTQRQFQGSADGPKGKKDDGAGEDPDEEDIVREAADQLSKEQKNRHDKGDVIHAEANDVISYDPNVTRFYSPGAEGWVKGDFAGVAAGFMTSKFMQDLSAQEGAVEDAIATIINFLRYVLQHDVCPEYQESVKAAWEICERAKIELPMCADVTSEAPGDLNTAARIVFCTDEQPHDCTVDPAAPTVAFREKDPKYWEFEDAILVPKKFRPRSIFKPSMIYSPLPDIAPWDYEEKSYAVKDTYNQDFEVVDPKDHPAIGANPELPHGENKDSDDESNVRDGPMPVGKVFVKPCVVEDGWDNRLSRSDTADQVEWFLFEAHILRLLTVGMKLRLVVCELDCGFKFVKQVLDVLPSFYTFLPQELMLRYKEPKLNDRPAPSVDDPDVETRAMEKMAWTDAKE